MTLEENIEKLTKNSNGYFWGVWGDAKPDKFFIVDKKFNIIFETTAFNDRGRFTEEVDKALEEYGIPKDLNNLRTDRDIQHLKERVNSDVLLYEMYTKRKITN